MAFNREYKKVKSPRKNSQRDGAPNILLAVGLVGLSAWLTWKTNENKLAFLSPPIISSLSEQIKYKIAESERPKVINPGAIEEVKDSKYLEIDKKAFSVHYQGTSVSELAAILSQYAKTEPEKARIAYSWITHNINYDVPAFLSGNYEVLSPEEVLTTRQAICSGYANLYRSLAKAMGLNAIIINGYAKGGSYIVGSGSEINHGWNGVKINGGWYLVDATWGAGTVNDNKFNKNFNPYYFATPPNQFIYDHLPSDADWQLLAKPYNKQQFDKMPDVSPQFFANKLRLISHRSTTIRTKGSVKISLSAPSNIIVASRLKQDSEFVEGNYTLAQKENNTIVVSATFPSAGNYELEIYSKQNNESGAYKQALNYNIVADATGNEYPLAYGTFSEKGAYLYSPVERYLPAQESLNFKISVPQALEVRVIDSSYNKLTQLTRSGSVFQGNVFVSSGKVQVVAKFPGDERYWTLLEYN